MIRQRHERRYPLFALVISLCVSLPAFPQSREEHVIVPQGGIPYLIVRKDETGPSKKEPGLYVRGSHQEEDVSHEDWRLAIPGEIFVRPVTGGVSLHLDMAKSTSRYEVLVVANGKIVLANIFANHKTQEGMAIFGEETAPIIDPLSGEKIRLPRIKNYDDFTIYQEEFADAGLNQKAQLILVSIKSDQLPYGDGVSFAAVLVPTENDESKEKNFKFLFEPVLIDYEFLDKSELRRRFQSVDHFQRIFSKSIFKRFAHTKNEDSFILEEWRALLRRFIGGDLTFEQVEKALNERQKQRNQVDHLYTEPRRGHLSVSDVGALPFLYAVDGQVHIDHLPFQPLYILGVELSSVVNPLTGESGVYYGSEPYASSDLSAFRPFIRGEVDHQKKALQAGETSDGSPNDIGILHMLDGRVMLITRGSKKNTLRQTELPFPSDRHAELDLAKFSWHYNLEHRVLLCSWGYGEGESKFDVTVAYSVDFTKPQPSIEATLQVQPRYFTSEELSWRTINVQGDLAFDFVTESVDNEGDYKDRHRLTAAHIQLNQSLRPEVGRPVIYFPKPLLDKVIGDESIFYREFESANGIESKTGLYMYDWKDGKRNRENFLRGVSPRKSEFRSLVIAEEKVPSGIQGAGEIHIRAVPLDSNFTNGDNTQVHLIFNLPESKKMPSVATLWAQPFAIERMSSFGLIDPVQIPEDKNARRAQLNEGRAKARLIAYATLKPTEDSEGQTILFQIDYERQSDQVKITRTTELKVESTELTESEILARILVDSQNETYWVQTPDRDRTDDKFQVLRISDTEAVRPRRHRDLRLQYPRDKGEKKEVVYDRDTWKVDDSLRNATEEERQRREYLRQAPEFQTDVFPDLTDVLESLANLENAPRHVVLVVPDELEEYVDNYIWALRYRDQRRLEHWSATNQSHVVFSLEQLEDLESVLQDDVFTNLGRMRDVGSTRRSLLVTNMNSLLSIDRPEAGDRSDPKNRFLLEERTIDSVGSGLESDSSVRGDIKQFEPHILYMLATEGNRIPLNEFDPKRIQRRSSQLLVASNTAWELLRAEAGPEAEYGLLDSFEVIELKPPTRDLRVQFAIDNVLRSPIIQSLAYRVSLEGTVAREDVDRFSPADAERKLMTLLVHRSEALATDSGMPVFESFMKVLNELARQLTQNSTYRRNRIIDRGVIEKVLTRIFPMPLNLNVLPENDPLRILSREDADFLWQSAGYPGSVGFKDKVIKTILSQLSTDDVRSMKSSAIIVGKTGSTKTRAITTLFQMLGLRHYDFNRNEKENEGSWAFVMNMSQILSSRGSRGKQVDNERMISFDDAKKHFDQFLSSENGPRGFIFLDDMHLAPDDVRAYFLRRIRALQEEKTYRSLRGDERPTRNITLFVAINPTDNQERIRKFVRKDAEPTEAELILATLTTEDYPLDFSFLARWGEVINLNYFPASSKAPAIIDVMGPARKAMFGNSQRLVFITPEIVDSIIAHSPKSDARTFLSTVTSRLMALPKGDSGHLYIIVPKGVEGASAKNSWEVEDREAAFVVGGVEEAASIEGFIDAHFHAISIDGTFDGRLEFLRFLVQNFRLKVFELVLQSMGQNRDFLRVEAFKQQVVLPLSQAIHRHLREHPEPFMQDFILEAREFGARTSNDRQQFDQAYQRAIMDQIHRLGSGAAPVEVGDVPRDNALAVVGMGQRIDRHTRQHALAETITDFTPLLREFLQATLNIKSLDRSQTPEEWLDSEFGDFHPADTFGKEVTDLISNYIRRIFDPHIDRQAEQSMSYYESMRLLCLAIDKAIVRLPWAKISRFIVEGLTKTSEDMSLGQSPHVQELLFGNRNSIFRQVDDGLVLGLAASMPYFDDRKREEPAQHQRFMSSCVSLLRASKGDRKGSP